MMTMIARCCRRCDCRLLSLALMFLLALCCSLSAATKVAAAAARFSLASPVLLRDPDHPLSLLSASRSSSSSWRTLPFTGNGVSLLRLFTLRGGSISSNNSNGNNGIQQYGRVSNDEFILTPEQVQTFHRDGCVTIPDVLTEEEVQALEQVANRFFSGEIAVPDKDFCDISKPFGIPVQDWSLVNCMLPTRYYPPLLDNVYEKLTCNMAKQLFPNSNMVKDYDQLLNKRPGKIDAVFAGSGVSKTLRPHVPLCGNRDEGHAVTVQVDEMVEEIRHAPAKRGSITIHDEYVVHGSSGNTCRDRQRRTYVIAHRAKEIVDAERKIGFTHSHNDVVNWDTFNDGESHRVKLDQEQEHDE